MPPEQRPLFHAQHHVFHDSGLLIVVPLLMHVDGPLLILAGPGSGKILARRAASIAEWLKAGGNMLAVGVEQADADALLPFKVGIKRAFKLWFRLWWQSLFGDLRQHRYDTIR